MVSKNKPDDNCKNINNLIKSILRKTSVKTLRSFISINNLITIKDKRDLLKKLVKYIKILTLTLFAGGFPRDPWR
jgi:hypothetical protein